jgi:hypothetical protein
MAKMSTLDNEDDEARQSRVYDAKVNCKHETPPDRGVGVAAGTWDTSFCGNDPDVSALSGWPCCFKTRI